MRNTADRAEDGTASGTAPVVRLVHLSDVHLTARGVWRPGDWLGKRFTSWVNLRYLGRGRRFQRADEVLRALRQELCQRRPDWVVFSGDATALGLEAEVKKAAQMLGVGEWPGLAVPGNHDYCMPRDMCSGAFERYFAPWQTGERVDGETYPFAQRVRQVWLVGVCSATANRLPMDARGFVGQAQLQRLEALLARLDSGVRILVTHYPIAIPGRKPEHLFRGLRDLDNLIAVAERGGIGLWLHGHRHDAYFHEAGRVAPFPVICAGSAAQTGLWSYGDYTITGCRLHARQRVFDGAEGRFRDGTEFAVELAVADVPGSPRG
jgi:3',5'-cyclic AMP phosphodiesterase CpdA